MKYFLIPFIILSTFPFAFCQLDLLRSSNSKIAVIDSEDDRPHSNNVTCNELLQLLKLNISGNQIDFDLNELKVKMYVHSENNEILVGETKPEAFIFSSSQEVVGSCNHRFYINTYDFMLARNSDFNNFTNSITETFRQKISFKIFLNGRNITQNNLYFPTCVFGDNIPNLYQLSCHDSQFSFARLKNKSEKFQISPNPTNGVLNITNNNESYNLSIFSLDGKLIFSKKMATSQDQINLSLFIDQSNLYIIQIIDSHNSKHLFKIYFNN